MEARWYGWQVLIVDGAATTAFVTGLATKSTPSSWLGFGTYLLGGSFVHSANGHGNAAAEDFLLRLLMPIGGAVIGLALATTCTTEAEACEVDGALLGLIAGAAGAMAIDAGVLANDTVPLGSQAKSAAPTWSFAMRPVVSPSRQLLMMGGTF